MNKKKLNKALKHDEAHTIKTQPLWQYLLPPFLIPTLIYCVYTWSFNYNFQFDDVASISKFFSNRSNSLSNLFFRHPRWISYWINSLHHSLYQFRPFGYRIFNVSLHSITSVLIFYFIYRALLSVKGKQFFTRNAFWLALSTALLFALHPVQTQTVSYVIQGQLEGLACFFAIACSLAFLLSEQFAKARTPLRVLLYILAALGTGSKEIFIVTPALILLVDWFFVAQGKIEAIKKRWPIHAGIFSIIVGSYIFHYGLRHFARLLSLQHTAINNIGNVLTQHHGEAIRPWQFFISQFKVVLHYIVMFIWPFNICVEYDWKLSHGLLAVDCFIPLLLLLAIGALLYKAFKKDKTSVPVFAAVWFLIVLAPRSSFIPSSELLTDYKTFMGSMGIFLILSCAIVYCIERIVFYINAQKTNQSDVLIFLPALVILMIPVGYSAYQRNFVWSSGVNFWANVLKNSPRKARAYNNYGVALSENKQFKESIPYYLKAIQMDNTYPDPVNNVAVAYAQTGNVDKGIMYLQEVIRMQPNYPEGYNNLASFLIQKNEYDKAEEILKVALKLRPHYGKAYYNLGKIYFSQKRMDEAYHAFKSAVTIADLDNGAGYETFGRICIALKKYDEAVMAFENMVRTQPNFDSLYHLANAYHITGRYQDALNAYMQANRMSPNDSRVVFNIGETYAKMMKPDVALEYFKQAQQLHSKNPTLPVRVAWCLRSMHMDNEAEVILEQLLSQPSLPGEVRKIAQNDLNELRSSMA